MNSLRVVLGAVLLLASFGSCAKKPTAAQTAALAYAEFGVKKNPQASDSTLSGGTVSIKVDSSEPEEGVFHVCGEFAGYLEWTRSAAVSETPMAGGDVVVELAVDVCMRGENGTCNRPNTYTLKALMRVDDGTWKVAGSSCSLKNSVR